MLIGARFLGHPSQSLQRESCNGDFKLQWRATKIALAALAGAGEGGVTDSDSRESEAAGLLPSDKGFRLRTVTTVAWLILSATRLPPQHVRTVKRTMRSDRNSAIKPLRVGSGSAQAQLTDTARIDRDWHRLGPTELELQSL